MVRDCRKRKMIVDKKRLNILNSRQQRYIINKVGQGVAWLTAPWLDGSLFLRIVPGVLITLAFSATFVLVAWQLRSAEFMIFRNAVVLRFRNGTKR